MKKNIILSILSVVVSQYALAQNTFPSSGNVGIGTNAPSNLFTVVKNTESGAIAYFDSQNTTHGYGIALNTEANNAATYALHAFRGGNQANSLLWLGTTGNLGLGTRTPGAKLSFADVTGNTVDGLTWHDPDPLAYGIHRTSGTWTAPDYQQLRLRWVTGIVIDPGATYGKSYVDIKGNGLRVTSGAVGIGTLNTHGHKLAVAGTAIAESMTVKLQGAWPDYVFKPGHQLPTLAEIEDFIIKNKHLPGIVNAKEVAENGINLGEMTAGLLQKIEELTLHLIQKDKEISELKKSRDRVDELSKKVDELLSRHPSK